MSEQKELPAGWAYATVSDLTTVVTSGSRGWAEHYSAAGALFLRVGNLRHGSIALDMSNTVRVTPPPGAEGTRTKIEPGDILLSITADVGMVGLVPAGLGDAYVNQHVALLRPSGVYPPYMACSLLDPEGFQREVRAVQYGMTKSGLSLIQVRRAQVKVSPLGEQRRIVEALDSYFSRLDEAVLLLERVQRNLARYRAAVLNAAVTGKLVRTEAELARHEGRDYEPASELLKRILVERRRKWEEAELAKMVAAGKPPKNGAWKAKYQEPAAPETSGLPELPEGWCWAPLHALFPVITDGDHQPPPQVPTGVPFLVIGNVSSGYLDLSATRFVPTDYYESLDPERCPKRGDILYTVTGSFGIPILVETSQRFCVQRHIAILRPAPSTDTRFFRQVLESRIVCDQARAIATGTAQKTVPLTGLRRLAVPLPPVTEQARILQEVDRRVSAADASLVASGRSLVRCGRLRQAILRWAFEGKLVDQDPANEPASALLDRIKAERAARAAEKPAKPKRGPRRRSAA